MAVETEVKIEVAGAEEGRRLLTEAGFTVTGPRALEENWVFDTVQGTYRASGRLVRLRCWSGQARLTYKGPAAGAAVHKSREEVEFGVSSAEDARKLLECLGLRQSYYYEKFRTEYGAPEEPGHAVLDETPVGVFLELEGDGDWIDRVATLMGFGRKAYITTSYAALHTAWVRTHGGDATAMRFPA